MNKHWELNFIVGYDIICIHKIPPIVNCETTTTSALILKKDRYFVCYFVVVKNNQKNPIFVLKILPVRILQKTFSDVYLTGH